MRLHAVSRRAQLSRPLTRRGSDLFRLVADPDRFGPWDLTDETLRRVVAECTFKLRDKSNAAAPALRHELHHARIEQRRRTALRSFWNATARGTDSYDEYSRLGRRPSYWLAMQMDWAAQLAGKDHALTRITPKRSSAGTR